MGGILVHLTYQVGLNGVVLPNVVGQVSWERGVSSLQAKRKRLYNKKTA